MPSADDDLEQRMSEDEEIREQKILALVQENARVKQEKQQDERTPAQLRSNDNNKREKSLDQKQRIEAATIRK